MDWHVDERLFEAYRQGGLGPSRVMAVDAHLRVCAVCRGAVAVDEVWLERSWEMVVDGLYAPGRLRTVARRAGLSDDRLRLLAATPALRWSWLAAVAAVLTFGVVAAYASDAPTPLLLFLVFAPVLPVLAVATAYGPPFDAMHEITATTPVAGPALVLWRATAVVGVSMAMGVGAAVLLPGPGWYAVAWLLPAFLLCVSSLALATVVALPLAAGLSGGVWLTAIAALSVAGAPVSSAAFGPAAQSGYLLAAAVSAVVLIVRRSRLDPGESQ